MQGVMQDIRYALRAFVRNPGFCAVVVLTIALGIGANAAVFSIVDGVLFRPLPFDRPDRIVRIWAADREAGDRFLESTFAEFVAFRESTRALGGVAAFSLAPRYLADRYGDPGTVTVARVAGNLFGMLGAAPALGRGFRQEDSDGSRRVVIVSDGIWQRRYGGDPDILGRSITIRREAYTVIGVMPSTFEYPNGAEMWRPFLDQEYQDDDRELHLVGRLAAGVTLEQASAEAGRIAQGLEEVNPENAGITAWAQPLHAMLVRNARTPLLVLWGAVGLVLLIACGNIANLYMSRAMTRRRELSMRSALGASRARLVRQLLTESMVLAFVGGVAGLLLARWVLDFIVAISPSDTPRMLEVALDGRVAAIMVGVTAISGIVSGLVPALHVSRSKSLGALRVGLGTALPGTRRVQRGVVIGEIALSTMLIVGAGLLMTSFVRQLRLDRGFAPERILTVPVDPPGDFASSREAGAFFDEIVGRVRQLPNIESVVSSTTSPMEPRGFRVRVRPSGERVKGESGGREVVVKVVSEGFFEALGIDVVAGRTFRENDDGHGEKVAVVNRTFAQAFTSAARGDMVGTVVDASFVAPRIVGMVADLTPDAGSRPPPTMYLSFDQLPIEGRNLLIRASSDPVDLVPLVRDLIWELDPTIPLDRISTVQQEIADSVASPRFNVLLAGTFAALAMLLAAVGVHGVLAYMVSQRRREMGIRQALGARGASIRWMVMGEGFVMGGIGLVLGLVGALALSRLLGSLLYGVGPADPSTYLAVAVLLTGVVAISCYMPARRAMGVDPIEALRAE